MGRAEWSRVLIVQTSFLGDTVLTLPLMAEVKRRFPAAKVTLLTTPLGKELLDGATVLDEIIVDDKRQADKGWSGLWRKARALRARGFTLALCPHKSFRSALLLFLARIPHRVGFRQSKGWFLFHSLANRNGQRHDVERNLSILEVFGIESEDCRHAVDFPVHDGSMAVVSRLLKEQGIDPEKAIVGIVPGSVWPTKRWAAESFVVLIQRLKRELDCEVILIGGPEDLAVAAKIERRIAGTAVNLVGKTSLRELPAALAHCRLLISNDSGPMHVAVAIGVPVVAIFCATTPSLGFYPYTSKAVVVEKKLSCRPCSSHGGRRCPLGTEDCIRLIEPDQVFRAAKRLMQDLAVVPARDFCGYQPRFVRL
jgi:lipopolysaccharide heptosyltransferase II